MTTKITIPNRLAEGEHFAEVNNIIIHYYVAGSGPVLLLPSPGWGPSVNYIMPLPLFEQYFTMVYFDTRHSGKSTGPEDSTQYALDNFIADIDALRIYLGQSKVYIAGHSGGGHQVLEYGIQHNENLSGIIAIDAIAATDELRAEEMMKRIMKKKTEPFYLENPEYYEKATAFMMGMGTDKTPRTLEEIIGTMGGFYFHDPSLAAKTFQNLDLNDTVFAYTNSNGFQGKNLLGDLHRITVPVLIIVGDDDFICDPVSQAARIRANIANSKLAVISNCGHMPWIEQPAEFYEQCETWFSEQQLKKS
ncbi:alpha/beta fold hydrolase [Mucilaginibacter kameinonensis]|uniref:alpha/beta fold hydrolase n=1 Tax=Mucilaginibacter kameinonensis TaxID=452286 RepID=UPI000EF8525F|nr:alpha/beta hydrolase [Mucilaginibacter kameinonensis]